MQTEMKHYKKLLELGCFTFSEANKLFDNINTTKSVLNSYVKKGYIQRVRRGLYISLDSYGCPVANQYEIASKITGTAVISHHSAFMYYGCYNQVSNYMFVSSQTYFKDFWFEGICYCYLPARINSGVEIKQQKISVTDIERTMLDAINDVDKVMGFEELIQCLSLVSSLDEEKMLCYLKEYNSTFLYQKVGFIFEKMRDDLSLNDRFFEECEKFTGNKYRALMKEAACLNNSSSKKWHITYPSDIWEYTYYADDIDVEI